MRKRMTFADELLLFAKTVDILNENLFKSIKEIINEYAYERWGVKYLKIMSLKFDSDGNKILRKFFLEEYSHESSVDDIVFVESSEGQMAFVIKNKEPVWITATTKDTLLSKTDKYLDHWSGLKAIPQYKNIVEDANIRTSIIVPFYEVEKGKRSLRGVANYEIEQYLPISKSDKNEISTLTDTISELLTLYNVRERQEGNTQSAIKRLRAKLENFTSMQRKNKIFLASPEKGNRDVKEVILEVLEKDFSDIELIDWENNNITGSISEKMFEDINSSRYGICYFSEWSEEKQQYVDNPNVMFEAGLMHAKFATFDDEVPLWIPLREQDSLDFPFDVQGFNTIIIPRNKQGVLNRKKLTKMIKGFMEAIISRAREDKF